MIRKIATILLVVVALTCGTTPAESQQSTRDILHNLSFQSGKITLGDNLADIVQTENFRFLNNADTQTFLTRIWGNPPGAGKNSLGMLLPVDPNPLTNDGWAVVITYEASGNVSDEDAEKIDYNDLLKGMQQEARESSKARISRGQEAIELIGWAKQPFYDVKRKKLHWAKHLRFGDGKNGDTLNYEIRILGRNGVLRLNVVASMDALASVDTMIPDILDMVHFNTGNTYAEFDPKIDTAATYGLAGLIAGGVLAKTGFFKGLVALLIASKKLFGLALFGVIAVFWGKIKSAFSGPSAPEPTAVDDAPIEDEIPERIQPTFAPTVASVAAGIPPSETEGGGETPPSKPV